MSQFISDSNASPLGGLFSLTSAQSEASASVGGNGFKLAMTSVESGKAMARQPLGLAVAAHHLPVGKDLPSLANTDSPSVLTQLELEQLSFAANAMGLKLPELLKDKFHSLWGGDLASSEGDTPSQTFVDDTLIDDSKDLVSMAITLSEEIDTSDLTDSSDKGAFNPHMSSALSFEGMAVGNFDPAGDSIGDSKSSIKEKDERLEISPADALSIGGQHIDERAPILEMDTTQPLEKEALAEFVSQWINTEINVVTDNGLQTPQALNNADEIAPQNIVMMTLSEVIEAYPSPKDWHAIKINVVEGDVDPSHLGSVPMGEKTILQLVSELADKAAESEAFLQTLSSRTKQPEALAQQFIRHFTAQLKTEVEPSSAALKEGAAVDLANAGKLTSEGLKFIQSLLDDRPAVERSVSSSEHSGSSSSYQGIANQRSPSVDAAAAIRPDPSPVNPQRPDFQLQMEQRIQWMLSRGLQTADIRVDPPDLGTIHIRVTQQGDQTQVVFTSQHANVREALENSLPRLREMLEQQGLNLAQTDVRDQGGRSSRDETPEPSQNNTNVSSDEEVQHIVTRPLGLVDTHV
ncbi:MAG TPA: flagellar hook-length control protein FliK [Pseudomonadales bacterium]|nr:flagellar hook-length control protein FliK [Pseudomonadales bacterium]